MWVSVCVCVCAHVCADGVGVCVLNCACVWLKWASIWPLGGVGGGWGVGVGCGAWAKVDGVWVGVLVRAWFVRGACVVFLRL